MQPSLYAPHVDISRARVGFGRVGLRLINRDLHAKDYLVQLQALHSVLDQVCWYQVCSSPLQPQWERSHCGPKVTERRL